MTNCIVCYNHLCKHKETNGCTAAVVEIGSDGNCLTYEEKDIYKEVEGFGRESKSDI